MQFDYLRLALGLVQALVKFLTFLRERELLEAGEARAVARMMKAAADDIARAEKVREEVRRRNDAVPSTSSLPDDGFQRKDN